MEKLFASLEQDWNLFIKKHLNISLQGHAKHTGEENNYTIFIPSIPDKHKTILQIKQTADRSSIKASINFSKGDKD